MEEKTYQNLDFKIWKSILLFLKPYRKTIIVILTLNALIGISETLFPLFSKYALDNMVVKKSLSELPRFLFFYMLMLLFSIGTRLVYMYTAGKMEIDIRTGISGKCFENLQRLSFSYYDRTPVGWIIARVGRDSTQFSQIISWAFLDIAYGSALLISYAAAMFSLNWKLALLSSVVVPIIAWISIKFHKKMIAIQREVKNANSDITAAYNEDIQGAKTTKTLVLEESNYEDFMKLTERYRKKSLNSALLSSLYLPALIALGSIATALVFSKGSSMVSVGALTVGTFSAMVTYSLQFYEPVRMVGGLFSDLLSAQASAERIFSLMEEKSDIKDSPEIIEKYGDSFDLRRDELSEIKGDVEFRNVSFYYNKEEPVLDNFSLKVKAGETIALVGETGSGKSTIINLFSRFYEPVEGEILIDGIDYRNMPIAWVHKNLGYVLQSPELFSGSIYENIAYGANNPPLEKVREAARLVDADGFIMETEKGYDTEVGEGGNRLSVGQKQLISFARALISNPKLIVLDEATSSVDTETEKKIQTAVEEILKGRTSFVVAHRLSTIRNASKILVIHRGKIAEQGNHSELMAKKGRYYDLYRKQFIEERERNWA